MMRWLPALFCLALASCQSAPVSEPMQSVFGPSHPAKVADGYQLVNRQLRVVIDEHTGTVSYLGTADGKTNLLAPFGITGICVRRPVVQPAGYIEQRDDQTWQYLGDAADGIGWRKIYCLDGPNVFVTYLIQNKTASPIETAIAIRATFAHASPMIAQPDLYEAHVGDAFVRLQAFNEFHDAKPDGDTLTGDSRTLKPGERISLTMTWHVDLRSGPIPTTATAKPLE